jgi:hypothetical protein
MITGLIAKVARLMTACCRPVGFNHAIRERGMRHCTLTGPAVAILLGASYAGQTGTANAAGYLETDLVANKSPLIDTTNHPNITHIPKFVGQQSPESMGRQRIRDLALLDFGQRRRVSNAL